MPACASAHADSRPMSTELLSRDLLHTRDAIDLPPAGEPVEGRAARHDTYPIARHPVPA